MTVRFAYRVAALAMLALPLFFSPGGAEHVPKSARSQAAVERAAPALRRDLMSDGYAWGSPVFIRIFKEESELEVWLEQDADFRLFRTYPICRFSGELGPKLQQGDGQSPEGFYFVSPGAMNPNSSYHLSFNLGFPNQYDRAHGGTGSYLMVHGDCVSVGCFAMAKRWLATGTDRNDPIGEIWTLMSSAFENGQPFVRVHSFPFRMSGTNMSRHSGPRWGSFWLNLKEGYDQFEHTKRPPNVEVRGQRYVIR